MIKILSLTIYLPNIIIIFAACESGTFGNNCSVNCYCINQTCDPINGTCPDGGCQRGYNGTTCSTSTLHGFIILLYLPHYVPTQYQLVTDKNSAVSFCLFGLYIREMSELYY